MDTFQKSHVTSFTAVNNLESWMISESRGSPDGGDDVSKSTDAKSSAKVSSHKTNYPRLVFWKKYFLLALGYEVAESGGKNLNY